MRSRDSSRSIKVWHYRQGLRLRTWLLTPLNSLQAPEGYGVLAREEITHERGGPVTLIELLDMGSSCSIDVVMLGSAPPGIRVPFSSEGVVVVYLGEISEKEAFCRRGLDREEDNHEQ